MFYYMNDSDKLNVENSYFKRYEMNLYFDTDKWDTLYCIENHKRVHGPHIYIRKYIIIKLVLFLLKRNIHEERVYVNIIIILTFFRIVLTIFFLLVVS